jgi:hypothetical protein
MPSSTEKGGHAAKCPETLTIGKAYTGQATSRYPAAMVWEGEIALSGAE